MSRFTDNGDETILDTQTELTWFKKDSRQIGPQILQHVSEQNFKRVFSVLLAIIAAWVFVDSKS